MITRADGQIECYQAVLAHHIDQIVCENPVPINLIRICQRYQLNVLHKNIADYRAYLAINDTSEQTQFFILVPQKSKGTRYERFCIAHELAHYILLKNFGTVAPAEFNHWVTEKLCDDFARRLLVPDGYLKEKFSNVRVRAFDFLRVANRVSSMAGIPWIHGARRVHEHFRNVCFLRMQFTDEARLKVVSTTLPQSKETGKLVDKGTKWAEMISKMSCSNGANEIRFMESVEKPVIASSGIRSLIQAHEVAVCVDHTRLQVDIRVGAVTV